MSESTKTIYLKNSEAYPAGGSGNFSRLPMEEHEEWMESQRLLLKFSERLSLRLRSGHTEPISGLQIAGFEYGG
jgi:hypothetical protein